MGYHRAGFEVVGVDINPQPYYPFEFHQGDALQVTRWLTKGAGYESMFLSDFDAVHASPPCQFATQTSVRWRGKGGLADDRLDLLTPTLALLRDLSIPWVVENVVGAAKVPGFDPCLRLHGGMFGLGTRRVRLFASNVLLLAPREPAMVGGIGIYGERPDGRILNYQSQQRAASSLEQAQAAMGMDWADWHGTKEAIPPAYTEFIGAQLLQHLGQPLPSPVKEQ